jgi:hypothetical protein
MCMTSVTFQLLCSAFKLKASFAKMRILALPSGSLCHVCRASTPAARAIAFKQSIGNAGKSMRASLGQMFQGRELRLTSAILLFIWLAVALVYYGMILFNTSLQVSEQPCRHEQSAGQRGPRLTSEEYRDVFVTTTGEV